MYAACDATGVDTQPRRDANVGIAYLFMAFILVGAFFVLNLIVGGCWWGEGGGGGGGRWWGREGARVGGDGGRGVEGQETLTASNPNRGGVAGCGRVGLW